MGRLVIRPRNISVDSFRAPTHRIPFNLKVIIDYNVTEQFASQIKYLCHFICGMFRDTLLDKACLLIYA
jgi:hypothetical protein